MVFYQVMYDMKRKMKFCPFLFFNRTCSIVAIFKRDLTSDAKRFG